MFLTGELNKKIHQSQINPLSSQEWHYHATTALFQGNDKLPEFAVHPGKDWWNRTCWWNDIPVSELSIPIPYFTILTLRTRPQSVWAHPKSAAPYTWPQGPMYLKFSKLCTKVVQLKPILKILYNLQIALLSWHWWRCCWCPGVPVIIASSVGSSLGAVVY